MDLISSLTGPERLLFIVALIEGVAVIFLVIIGTRLRRLIKQYRGLLRGKSTPNLEETLITLGNRVEDQGYRLAKLEDAIVDQAEKSKCYLHKWSLLRYRAFANVGGDQSFSLAVLDKNDDGFIISSIYGRDESRIYAKTIKEGRSSYPLSDEERQVLTRAIEIKSS